MWTAQRTWVVGETVSASQLNVMVRDDLNFLYSPPGAVVTNDQAQNVATGGSLSSLLVLSFPLVLADTDDMTVMSAELAPFTIAGTSFSPARPSSLLEVHTAGRYLITGSIVIAVGLAGWRGLSIGVITAGVATGVGGQLNPNPGTTNPTKLNAKTIWDYAIGDLIPLVAQITQTASADIQLPSDYPVGKIPLLTATWLGN